uniref:Uncharacterized protein n=1 Tax=Nelumbo nucifera TaxID=4432 RepID=A0A822YTT4_NELNU|nr:TPA_asm: hypothetical protein HUJ06_006587 [Nelumbo nucifera]
MSCSGGMTCTGRRRTWEEACRHSLSVENLKTNSTWVLAGEKERRRENERNRDKGEKMREGLIREVAIKGMPPLPEVAAAVIVEQKIRRESWGGRKRRGEAREKKETTAVVTYRGGGAEEGGTKNEEEERKED